MTGSAVIVLLISYGLKYFDIEVGDEQVSAFVQSALDVAGFLGLVYAQLRRKDLIAGVIRK